MKDRHTKAYKETKIEKDNIIMKTVLHGRYQTCMEIRDHRKFSPRRCLYESEVGYRVSDITRPVYSGTRLQMGAIASSDLTCLSRRCLNSPAPGCLALLSADWPSDGLF